MRKPLRLAAAAVVLGVAAAPAVAAPTAAPGSVADPAVECAKQYLIVAGPAPSQPVTVTSDGKVVVDAGPTVAHVVDFGGDTVRFARCTASSSTASQ
jgi:hypothetical protein